MEVMSTMSADWNAQDVKQKFDAFRDLIVQQADVTIMELRTNNEQLTAQHEVDNKRILELASENEELSGNVHIIMELRTKNEQLMAQQEVDNKRILELASENEELSGKIHSLSDDRSNLEQERDKFIKQIEELQEMVSHLEDRKSDRVVRFAPSNASSESSSGGNGNKWRSRFRRIRSEGTSRRRAALRCGWRGGRLSVVKAIIPVPQRGGGGTTLIKNRRKERGEIPDEGKGEVVAAQSTIYRPVDWKTFAREEELIKNKENVEKVVSKECNGCKELKAELVKARNERNDNQPGIPIDTLYLQKLKPLVSATRKFGGHVRKFDTMDDIDPLVQVTIETMNGLYRDYNKKVLEFRQMRLAYIELEEKDKVKKDSMEQQRKEE